MADDSAKQQLDLGFEVLDEARASLEAGTIRAGFSRVYYALYHGARAALEIAGSEPKSHQGVLNQFGKHYRDDAGFSDEDFQLLAQARTFREMADYQIDPATSLNADRPGEIIERTDTFLERVKGILDT